MCVREREKMRGFEAGMWETPEIHVEFEQGIRSKRGEAYCSNRGINIVGVGH